MKQLHLLLTVMLVAPAIVFAEPKKDRPDTDIEKAMDKMAGAYRKLRRQVTDPAQNAASLELVVAVKAGATEARKYTPLKADDLPEPERVAFVENFQRKMDEFLGTAGRLEDALKAGNNDEAARLVAELGKIQKADHKEFRRPEKDDKN
jgi:soluble cytochrome b562